MVRPGKRNLAAQGFRIRRTCRRMRISLGGTAALQTSLKDFLHPPPKGEGANRRNSVLAELQGPAANRAQYAAISSFSPDSWLTTAVFSTPQAPASISVHDARNQVLLFECALHIAAQGSAFSRCNVHHPVYHQLPEFRRQRNKVSRKPCYPHYQIGIKLRICMCCPYLLRIQQC